MGIDTSPSISLKDFMLKRWFAHFIASLAFIIVLIIVRDHYTDTSATRTDFLINLICLPLSWTHAIIILILSMRRYARKQVMPGTIYLAHFFGAATIGYYLYVILMLFGWAYTMKGH